MEAGREHFTAQRIINYLFTLHHLSQKLFPPPITIFPSRHALHIFPQVSKKPEVANKKHVARVAAGGQERVFPGILIPDLLGCDRDR